MPKQCCQNKSIMAGCRKSSLSLEQRKYQESDVQRGRASDPLWETLQKTEWSLQSIREENEK